MKKVLLVFFSLGILLVLCAGAMVWYLEQYTLSVTEEYELRNKAVFVICMSFPFFIISYFAGKMKNVRRFCFISCVIFAFSFLVFLPVITTPLILPFRYTYESSDRKFAMYEHVGGKTGLDKSIDFAQVKSHFEKLKDNKSTSYLCRTFPMDERIKWYHFYRWLDYRLNERWQLPYLTPSANPKWNKP